MRQRQLLFLSINRIFLLLYAPLSVALGVYYLFTGNLLHAFLSVCTLFWIFIPYLLRQAAHMRIGQLLLFFYYIFVLLSYSGGIVLSFCARIPLYDKLIYLLSGFLLCIFASLAFCFFMNQRPKKKNLWFANLFCFCFSIAAVAVWKLFQAAVLFLVLHASPEPFGIVCDLLACLLGAVGYCCLTALYVYKDIHAYPLYAGEDFAALNIKSTVEVLDSANL